MDKYPMTFDEFTQRFSTDEQCREYLYNLRWESGFACPKCGYHKCWARKDELYECARCGYKASVTAGTIFQDTRKPLKTWFIAIWWVCTQKNGASAEGLQQILGLKTYETAWAWLHKIRTAMVYANRTKDLSDNNLTVSAFNHHKKCCRYQQLMIGILFYSAEIFKLFIDTSLVAQSTGLPREEIQRLTK
jgi:predicted RNA-binding Zn-ribbon protein involved in translation (DUF1610 family)